MSRKGNCWNHAVAEGFFGTLKKEVIQHEKYVTKAQAALRISECIEVFYNRQPHHFTLGYLSPSGYEKVTAVA